VDLPNCNFAAKIREVEREHENVKSLALYCVFHTVVTGIPAAETVQRKFIGILVRMAMEELCGPQELRTRPLHDLERKYGRSVKRFLRNNDKEVRSASALSTATEHLVQVVLRGEVNVLGEIREDRARSRGFAVLYGFLADRFAAVRQDMTIIRMRDERAVKIYEVQVVLHVFAFNFLANRLGDDSPGFDAKLCVSQLQLCLGTLMDLYMETKVYSSEFVAANFLFQSENVGFVIDAREEQNRSLLATDVGKAVWKYVLYRRRGLARMAFRCQDNLRSPFLRLFLRALDPSLAALGLEQMNKAFSHREPMSISKKTSIALAWSGSRRGLSKICEAVHLKVEGDSVVFKSAEFSREDDWRIIPWQGMIENCEFNEIFQVYK